MGCGIAIDVDEFILKLEKAVTIATLESGKVPKSQLNLTAGDVGAQPLGNELTAIQSLADTVGLIRKIGNGAYSIDTSSYLTTETDPTVAAFTKTLTSNNTILAALNAASGTISANVLPSYVDDYLEFATLEIFPVTGETGKIYLAQNTNLSYRWTGSVYVDISSAGTADAALRLNTPRTISVTGDAVYLVSFDGSGNVSGVLSLASVNGNTGTFGSTTQTPVITVDAKGRITAVSVTTVTPAWASIASKPTTLAGFGITDAQPLGNELTALQALADTAGFLRKTGNGAYSIDTSSYLPTTGGTVSGNVNLSATTPSTSPTTGASVITGGQGIGGSQFVGGNLNYAGDLLGGTTGSWIPIISGETTNPTVTYSVQQGEFFRLGKLVVANFYIGYTAISGGSGSLRISLPIASKSPSVSLFAVSSISYATNVIIQKSVPRVPGAGVAFCFLRRHETAVDMVISDLPASVVFIGSIMYLSS